MDLEFSSSMEYSDHQPGMTLTGVKKKTKQFLTHKKKSENNVCLYLLQVVKIQSIINNNTKKQKEEKSEASTQPVDFLEETLLL